MSQHQTNQILCFEFLCQFNTGQADGTPGLDLNVAEAWELGYTGKGVTIGIMDDGEYLTGSPHLHASAFSASNIEAWVS